MVATSGAVELGSAGGTGLWGHPEEYEETPELRWPYSVEVYDRMRRQDSQVKSVMRAVTLPIRRTPWRVDPNGARDEVVEFVSNDLGLPILGAGEKRFPRTRDRFSWAEHLRHALLSLDFGHSFFEQVYRIGDDGMAHLRKLGWRPPRTLTAINVASDGGLASIEQTTEKLTAVKIPVDRLVAHVNDREGGNWLGQSLLRPAYKFWLLKDRMLRTGSLTVERNGLGIPVYTAPSPPNDSAAFLSDKWEAWVDKQIAAGLDIARSYRAGNSAGVSLAPGASLELKGVTGALPDALLWIRYFDEQIARAVLAHFLNLGTETGSWALGSTFADFFTLSLQTTALQVADVTSQHVVEDLVDLNFGESEAAPRIVSDEIGARHPATAQAIQQLIACGAILPDESLEEFVRTQFGLPSADKDTRRSPSGGGAGEGSPASEREVPRWPGS